MFFNKREWERAVREERRDDKSLFLNYLKNMLVKNNKNITIEEYQTTYR